MATVLIDGPEGGRLTVTPHDLNSFTLVVQESATGATGPRTNTAGPSQINFNITQSGSVSGQVNLFPLASVPIKIHIERRVGAAFDPRFIPVDFTLAVGTAPWSVAGLEPGIYTFYFSAGDVSPNGKFYEPIVRQLQVTAGQDLSGVSVTLGEYAATGAIDLSAVDAAAAPLSEGRGFIRYENPTQEIYPGFRQEFGIENGSAQIGGFVPGNRIFISAERRDPMSGELEEITGSPTEIDIVDGPPILINLQTQVPASAIPINPSPAPRIGGAPRINFVTNPITPLPDEISAEFTDRFGRRSESTLPVQSTEPGRGSVTVPVDRFLSDMNFRFSAPNVLRARLRGVSPGGLTFTGGDILLVVEGVGVPSKATRLEIVTPLERTFLFPAEVVTPRLANLPFRVNMRGEMEYGFFGIISVITNPLSPKSEQTPITCNLFIDGSAEINGQGVADTSRIAGPNGDLNMASDDIAERVDLRAVFGIDLEPDSAQILFYDAGGATGRVNTLNGSDSQPIVNGGARIHAIPVGGFEPVATAVVNGALGQFVFEGLPSDDYVFLSIPLITDPMGGRYLPDCEQATVVDGQTTSNLALIHQASPLTGQLNGALRDHEGTALNSGTVRAFRTDFTRCMDVDPTAGVLTAASEAPVAPGGFFSVQRLGGTYTVIAEAFDFPNNRTLTNGRGQEVTLDSGQVVPFDIVATPVGTIDPIHPVAFERVSEGQVSLMWNPKPASGTPIDRFLYEVIIRDQLGTPVARFTDLPNPGFVWTTPEFRPGIYEWEVRGFRDDGLEELRQSDSPLALFEVVGREPRFD
jgi:hypothetical protein